MSKESMETKLLELYKEFNRNRIDYNARKWETAKFFQGVFSALMVAFAGGVTYVYAANNGINHEVVQAALFSLPLFSLLALGFGIQNLRRESELLYIEEGMMFKILKLISLPKVSRQERWLLADPFFLPAKYREPQYGKGLKKEKADFEEWVEWKTKKHYFLRIFVWLFRMEMIGALILASIIAAIKVTCWTPLFFVVMATVEIFVHYYPFITKPIVSKEEEMQKKMQKRVVTTTLFGGVFGVACMSLLYYYSKVSIWPVGIYSLIHHCVMGLTIGVSTLKVPWAAHGILWGFLFGLFLTISYWGGPQGFWVPLALVIVWGFLIELITSGGLKLKAGALEEK